MSKSKVLFLMTGSIACYKACHVISRLVQAGSEVQVVASAAALKFVGPATLEGLSSNPVIDDMYASGSVMQHIHLMRWADLILVAPATANYINKIAQGLGDDLLTTLFLAYDFQRPFLLAPAMNTSMFQHPITQKSLTTLKSMGLDVLSTDAGNLACGEEGLGRLMEPDAILEAVLQKLETLPPSTKADSSSKSQPLQGIDAQRKSNAVNSFKEYRRIKVLVTAGGTQEPIDTVRVLSNLSSGRTGISIAESLSHMGMDVTLLQSHGSPKSEYIKVHDVFTSFASLDEKLKFYLGSQEYSHIIHTAAVSDYSVADIEVAGEKFQAFDQKKISSDADTMTIHLKRNHKIVDQLKSYSKNKDLKVVAFKLTSHANAEQRKMAIDKLFAHSHADYVVHNDITDIDIIHKTHKFTLVKGAQSISCPGLQELTNQMIQIITMDSEKKDRL